MMQKKILDVFPAWITTGAIFKALSDYVTTISGELPWEDEIDADSLDLRWMGHSGKKTISPLVQMLLYEGTMPAEALAKLAKMIYQSYALRWSKLWDTLLFEYEPIENYSMVETMTNDQTIMAYGKTTTETPATTVTTTYGKTTTTTPNLTVTDTLTDDETVTTYGKTTTETPGTTVTEENEISGFNSTAYGDSDKRTTSTTGTNQTADSGDDSSVRNYVKDTTTTGNSAEAITGSDSTATTGTNQTADSGQDTSTRNYLLKRSGNIGVTTSQQMIESERQLWMWDYFTIIFKDIDGLFTLAVYD